MQLVGSNYKFVTADGEDMTPVAGGTTYTITGTGKITPLALTIDNVTLSFDAATPTKEYDGTEFVKKNQELTDEDNNYITNFYVDLGNGVTQAIVYDYEAAYNDKDVADANTVNYKLGINGDNYTIDQSLIDQGKVIEEDGKYKWVASTAGVITPRTLDVVYDEGIRKIYDGDQTVEAEDLSKIHLANDDLEVLEADEDVANPNNLYAVTSAKYTTTNANVNPQGEENDEVVNDDDHININYTVQWNDLLNGNYNLVGADANGLVNGIAKGDIERRKVSVEKVNDDAGLVPGKPYDGSPDMAAAAYSNDGRFQLAEADDTTGVIKHNDVAEVTINPDAIVAAFDNDGHVNREDDGMPAPQGVTFTIDRDNVLSGSATYPAGNYYVTTEELHGSGLISPLDVTVKVTNAPEKTYDGKNFVVGTNYLTPAQAFNVGDDIDGNSLVNYVSIQGTPHYDNENAGTVGYTYNIQLDSIAGYNDYNLVLADNQEGAVDANGLTATLTGDGTINKRIVTPTLNGVLTKVYDGAPNPDGSSEFVLSKNMAEDKSSNNVKKDENGKVIYDTTSNNDYPITNARFTVNAAVDGGDTGYVGTDDVQLKVTEAKYDGGEAGKAEDSNELKEHVVNYTLKLENDNYMFGNGTNETTLEGTGYIARKGLEIVATPATANVGGSKPHFTGTVEGFEGDDANTYADFTAQVMGNFDTREGVTTAKAGTYGVYSWYRDDEELLLNTENDNPMEGNLGLNYYYRQAPANAKAFTVKTVNIPKDNDMSTPVVPSTINNPDTKITPTNDIYTKISHDGISSFGENGVAAIEYVDKQGKVIGSTTIDSGVVRETTGISANDTELDMDNGSTTIGNISLVGGDIINLEGGDAAGNASISVEDSGTVVNLEILPTNANGEIQENNSTAVAEITGEDVTNVSNGTIEIREENPLKLAEEKEDKTTLKKKESEIAIEGGEGDKKDEMEIKTEGNGVNAA